MYAYNQRSCRLLERHGFRLEGCLRDAAFKEGAFTDSLVYGLLRRDPQGVSSSTGEAAAPAAACEEAAGRGTGAAAASPAAEGGGGGGGDR